LLYSVAILKPISALADYSIYRSYNEQFYS